MTTDYRVLTDGTFSDLIRADFFPSLMPRDATVKPTPLKNQKTVKAMNGDLRFNDTMDLNASQITSDNGVPKDNHHHTHHAPEKDAIVEDLSDEDMNRKSYTPEHLSFYIDPESYFGEKQKHAPTIDAVSMTNVIHALYSPPPNNMRVINELQHHFMFDTILYSSIFEGKKTS